MYCNPPDPRYARSNCLFLGGRGDDLAAVVFAATRADTMRALHLAAIRAGNEMIQAERVVRATLVAARFRDFPLGNCTHDISFLLKLDYLAVARARPRAKSSDIPDCRSPYPAI